MNQVRAMVAFVACIQAAGCRDAPPAAQAPQPAAADYPFRREPISAFAVSPDGRRFGIASANRPRMWQFELDMDAADSSADGITRWPSVNPGWIMCSSIVFSPNPDWFVCDVGAFSSGTDELLFLEGSVEHVLSGASDWTLLRFSKDGKYLTGLTMFDVFRWEVATGRQVSKDRVVDDWYTAQFVPGSHAEEAYFHDKAGNYHVWNVRARKRSQSLPHLKGRTFCSTVLQGKWTAFILDKGQSITMIDARSGKGIGKFRAEGIGADPQSVDWLASPLGGWIGYRSPAKDALTLVKTDGSGTRKVLRGFFIQNWGFLNEDYVYDFVENVDAYEISTASLVVSVAPDLGPIKYTRTSDMEYSSEQYEAESWTAFTPDGRFSGIDGAQLRLEPARKWRPDAAGVATLLARAFKPARPDQGYVGTSR